MTEQRKCIGTTRSGDRCRMSAQTDSAYCLTHDPAKVAERQEWRSRGGRRAASARYGQLTIAPVKSLSDLKALVAFMVVCVAQGKCSIRQGEIVSSLAEKYLRITEFEQLQREVESLKAKLGENGTSN